MKKLYHQRVNVTKAIEAGRKAAAKSTPLALHRMLEYEGGIIPDKFWKAIMDYKPMPLHWSER